MSDPNRRSPSRSSWLSIASRVAADENVDLVALLSGSRQRKVVRARWRAWAELLEKDRRYCYAGIARVAGFDHTTVMYGLKREAGYNPKDCRRSLVR